MKVTDEQVRTLQKRIDITYEEAERFIRRADGDIDKAEHLVREHRDTFTYKATQEINRIYKEVLTYYIKITRKNKTVLDLPLLVIVGLFMVLASDSKVWVAIICIGLILLSESSVAIYRMEASDERIVRNDEKVKEPEGKSDSLEEVKVAETDEEDKDQDDDFYEITIDK